MADLIQLETLERGIVSAMLCQPDRRNALSIGLLEKLCAEIELLAIGGKCRVVILRGAGPIFSSGLDLREASDRSLSERSANAVSRALELFRTSPLVSIAAVQGGAFAGGAGLVAACDFAVATEDAKIGFPEARRGLLPALIASVLRDKVRESDLRELFLTGEPVDAGRALQIGLIQRVVPSDRLLEESLGLARAVIAGGPETIRQTKVLLNRMFSHNSRHADGDLVAAHLAARSSDEAREGLAAFIEKRAPGWVCGE